jgi:hypothetical protein
MVQFQKLTRNLFLTLHGHNVHRQQLQLSKFRMRYQQLSFHAYCGLAGPVSKMASQQEHTESLFLLRRHLGNWARGPAMSRKNELLLAHEKTGQLQLLTVYVVLV